MLRKGRDKTWSLPTLMRLGCGRHHGHVCLPLLPAHDVLEQLAGRQLAQHLPVAVGKDGICMSGRPTGEESEVKGQAGRLRQGSRAGCTQQLSVGPICCPLPCSSPERVGPWGKLSGAQTEPLPERGSGTAGGDGWGRLMVQFCTF